ncbi:hypothetical protein D3H64_06855 [Atopobacter sp. AH10]|uniref:YceD family protein n=1 Tax=Atopobacter sp. AH10 TaxID=2315861 RepID=UPI000EF193E2|nr:YceD family protein [Atopobacter sp. AH10]RLK62934.1 hypothetical protein D3H64_06855 [Atopobacter sp. AH10]
MRWSVRDIQEEQQAGISVDERVDLTTLLDRDESILAVDTAHVTGHLLPDVHGVIVHLQVEVKVTLPSSRSLKAVEIPVLGTVDERYVEASYLTREMKEGTEVVFPLSSDVLDLKRAVEDAVLLALPLQVLAEDEKTGESPLPSGQGWEVLTEETYRKRQRDLADVTDPRLKALEQWLDKESAE